MTDLAVFLATSGHSGVDRIMKNLIPAMAAKGIAMDILRLRDHGPYWESLPQGVRLIDLGAGHVNTSLPALVGYLRKVRPKVLLTDKDRVNRAALWARKIAQVPTRVVVRIGTTVSENLARRSWWARTSQRISLRCFYPWADGIIVPSRGAAEDLIRVSGLPGRKITVVPSPVIVPEMFQKAAEKAPHPWLADNEIPVIIGVGELCARKDFATLIQAFAQIRAKRLCRLIILGEGRQRSKLESLICDLGLTDCVHLPGFVNPYPWLSRASVFVSSSRCEGLPVALIEALALGVPSVAADCPSGPREILADGRYGPLVPVGDRQAMAQAIGTLLEEPVPLGVLQKAVQPYFLENSLGAYSRVLGL